MLQSLTIENFKALERLEMTGLKRINLIGGANNIGKSTVLEAIYLLFAWGDAKAFKEHLEWRGVSGPWINHAHFWSFFYSKRNINNAIYILAMIDNDVEGVKNESVDISFNKEYFSLFDIDGKGQVIFDGSVKGAAKVTHNRAGCDSFAAHVVKMMSRDDLAYYSEGKQLFPSKLLKVYYHHPKMSTHGDDAKLFDQMNADNREGEVVEFVKKFEPGIVSIATVSIGGSSELYVDVGFPGKIPFSLMGDGTVRMLSIFLRIAQVCQNGILLIDEVENGIHHSIMADYWRAIAAAAIQYNCQIFATTHSYECIQAAYQGIAAEHPGMLNFIRLDRRKSGELYAKDYDDQTLETSFEVGLEVR